MTADASQARTVKAAVAVTPAQGSREQHAHELASLRSALAEARGALARAHEERSAVRRQLDDIAASTIWRATAPLRRGLGNLPAPARLLARRVAKAAYWALTPWKMPARIRFLRQRRSGPADNAQAAVVDIELSTQRATIANSPLFDAAWYARNYGLPAHVDPLRHYLTIGVSNGNNPGAFFDTKWYLARNVDVAQGNANPLVHFIEAGAQQGCAPHPRIDIEFYKLEAGIPGLSSLEALYHYIGDGSKRGLLASPRNMRLDRIGHAIGQSVVLDRKTKVTVGIVIFDESKQQVDRIVRSAMLALARCGDVVEGEVRIFDNGGHFDPNDIPRGVIFMPSGQDEGFAVGHSKIMDAAFGGLADVYIGANPDGGFEPDCIIRLLKMNVAQDDSALLEAVQFPDEHPKFYHPETLETPWISCACFLMPRKIWEKVGGFDRNIYLYCDDVDLSWTVQHLGFGTMTCPVALFHHDISQRGFQRWRHRESLISGRYLAHKWGSREFRDFAEQRLVEQGFFGSVDELPPLDAFPTIDGVDRTRDFAHGFRFAASRW